MIHRRRTKCRRRKLYRQTRRNCRGGATPDASRRRRQQKLNLSRTIQTHNEQLDNVNAWRKYIAERRTAAKEKRLIEKLESKSLPPAEHNEMIELIRQKSQTLTHHMSPKSSIGKRRGETHIKQNTRSKTREQTRKETIAKYKKKNVI